MKEGTQNNIILIGMPGCGKSTIGVVLAKRLGYAFVDSDLVIQDETGKLLHELISEYGREGFLEIENRINAKMERNRSVISTGGSAVYGREAMEHFKSMGTVVYLQLPLEELKERLGDLEDRGVVLQPGQTLGDLYEERIPLYEKYADITIPCAGRTLRENMMAVADRLKEGKR